MSTNFSCLPLSGAGRVQVRHSRRYHVLRALLRLGSQQPESAEASVGLRPRLASMASTRADQLAPIAAALREFVRDNDLASASTAACAL